MASGLGFLLIFICAIIHQDVSATKFHHHASFSTSFHINHFQRMKRQASTNFTSNTTDTEREPDVCVVKCLRATEEKLGALQDEASKDPQQSPLSPQTALSRDYDPRDFQKLCDAYRPGRNCLDACQTTKLKSAALKGMQLLQFMCVERYEDFKENLPCLNNASAQAEVICKSNCSQFETAVNRLEELSRDRDLILNLSQKHLSETLSGSCQYVECLGHCGNPITKSLCGMNVAELDQELVRHVFNSLRHTVTALGAGDQLPKECLKLGE